MNIPQFNAEASLDWLDCYDNCTDDCPGDWSSIRCGALVRLHVLSLPGGPGSQPSNGAE